MSRTYSLVCHETKQRVWIGQGGDQMRVVYSGEQETMRNLAAFLNATRGRQLEFVCNDETDSVYDYCDFVAEQAAPDTGTIDVVPSDCGGLVEPAECDHAFIRGEFDEHSAKLNLEKGGDA